MNVWEKNAVKLRRRAQLRKFDNYLLMLWEDHPIAFHVLTILFAGALFAIAFGLERLIERIFA